jgi:RNA polymerase sigma-70 factor (ECF subfamily)
MDIGKKRFSENELVHLSQNGDIAAFARLVKEYSTGVLTFINRIVSSKEDAEDISQEVFVKAYIEINKFKGYSSFKTWLYAISKNMSYSYLQKKRSKNISLNKNADLIENTSINYPDISTDSIAVREDFLDIVTKSLSELPPKYNIIIQLYYYKHFKYKEISEILQIPIGTVKTHLYRALQILRKEVLKNLERGNLL